MDSVQIYTLKIHFGKFEEMFWVCQIIGIGNNKTLKHFTVWDGHGKGTV